MSTVPTTSSVTQPAATQPATTQPAATQAPVRFDRYMDNALYGEDGFYTQGGRPGLHRGDFGTSPERGQLFARCLAKYLDKTWHELGEPFRFLVIEAGAGTGTLCQVVLEAEPECVGSLCYMLVERSEKLRNIALERLAPISAQTGVPITAIADLPATIQGVVLPADLPAAAGLPAVSQSRAGVLPTATQAVNSWAGVIVANELLDNMAVRVVERSDNSTSNPTGNSSDSTTGNSTNNPIGWQELYLTPDPSPGAEISGAITEISGAQFTDVVESFQAAPPAAAAMANKLYPDAPVGTRLPLHTQANVWIRRALRLLGTAQQTARQTSTAQQTARQTSTAQPAHQSGATQPARESGATQPAHQLGTTAPSDTAQRGRILIFDYGTATTAELADRTMAGWLRTYADHRLNPVEAHVRPSYVEAHSHSNHVEAHDPANHHPHNNQAEVHNPTNPTSLGNIPKAQNSANSDITCDVGFDQLPPGYTLTTQADWLAANGLHQLTDPAKQRWQSQLANPTSETLANRALLDETDDLTNPVGLGSFLVAEWHVEAEPDT